MVVPINANATMHTLTLVLPTENKYEILQHHLKRRKRATLSLVLNFKEENRFASLHFKNQEKCYLDAGNKFKIGSNSKKY